PTVDQRHPEASAEHTEDGVGARDPQIAPERELQPAGDRVALDGGDHRLRDQHARRAHRAVDVVVDAHRDLLAGHYPVGPNRSTRIRSTAKPTSTSSSLAASAKPADPHTYAVASGSSAG